jgi:oxygen-dependent protoporphyrinogen oxidase
MTERVGTLVVGGGLSGLTHARALMRRGSDCVLLEQSERPGGAARSLEKGGYLLELGPNTVRPTPALLQICREIGLEKEILLSDPHLPRYVEVDGRLKKIPFGALSFAGLLRAGAEVFVRGGGSDEESVFDFFARRFGRQVAEQLVEPFVSGIFAGDARRLSVSATFPRLAELEAAHGGVLWGMFVSRRRGPRATSKKVRGLLSFRQGLAALPAALAESLGRRFRAGVRVEKLERGPDQWLATTSAGLVSADQIVLATPSAEAGRLSGCFAPAAAQALEGIASPPVTVAHCAWARSDVAHPLRGFGHLLLPREGRRILGAVWSSSLFPGRAPRGRVLLTVFLGGRRTPENAEFALPQLSDVIFEETQAVLGARCKPEIVHAISYVHAIPQYETGYGSVLAALSRAEMENPGLKYLGNYRGGISVGDVVDNAAIFSPA